MKKNKQKSLIRRIISKTYYKKCPVVGGWCFNPLCAFGCIER